MVEKQSTILSSGSKENVQGEKIKYMLKRSFVAMVIILLFAFGATGLTPVSASTGRYRAAQTLGAWSSMGMGLNDRVRSIVTIGTDVYAGGSFTDAGGVINADHIAKWNGTSWSALGTSLNNQVYAMAAIGTNLYVGGGFFDAGGVANADHIAKWNGTSWSALGTGLNGPVIAIAVNGADVYAAGLFTNAGGNANADYIAKWNGTSWSALGTTPLNNFVEAIAIHGTDVYVGGLFTSAGGNANADYLAKWNGTSWSALGTTPLNADVEAIAVSGTDVYVGGLFTSAGGNTDANYIAKWNGTSWSDMNAGISEDVNVLTISGTNLYVGGFFSNAGGNIGANLIASYGIPAIPPVTQTFTSIAAQDGWMLESSETSSRGGKINSNATTLALGDDVSKKQYRSILSFNTSALPDNANITSVVLKVKTRAIVGGGNPVSAFKGFVADIKTGVFGTSVLQTTDFQAPGNGTYGPFVVAPLANGYSINLTGGKAQINKLTTSGGLTQIRLRFKLDDNNNALANYLSLYSGNAATPADRPQLVITYIVP